MMYGMYPQQQMMMPQQQFQQFSFQGQPMQQVCILGTVCIVVFIIFCSYFVLSNILFYFLLSANDAISTAAAVCWSEYDVSASTAVHDVWYVPTAADDDATTAVSAVPIPRSANAAASAATSHYEQWC